MSFPISTPKKGCHSRAPHRSRTTGRCKAGYTARDCWGGIIFRAIYPLRNMAHPRNHRTGKEKTNRKGVAQMVQGRDQNRARIRVGLFHMGLKGILSVIQHGVKRGRSHSRISANFQRWEFPPVCSFEWVAEMCHCGKSPMEIHDSVAR